VKLFFLQFLSRDIFYNIFFRIAAELLNNVNIKKNHLKKNKLGLLR